MLTGTSEAADPALAGMIVAQSTTALPAYAPYDSNHPLFVAEIRTTVLRESTGPLDFYYQIINNNAYSVDPVGSVAIAGFSGATADANFRTDLSGSYAPTAASRDITASKITFSNFPFADELVFFPNQETNAVFVRTSATNFSDAGTIDVEFKAIISEAGRPSSSASAILPVYAPAPAGGSGVPEPTTLWLFGLAMAALVGRLKFARA